METVPRKPATIRDVARMAGVGLGTVSRVLNNSPQVSEATRQRVQQIIQYLHFVPSTSARRLSLGKTLTIAAIVPFFTRPSVIERLRGINATISGSAYDLIMYNVETVEKRDTYLRDVPRSDRADGVVIISLSPRDEDLPFLAKAELPLVFVDANHPQLTDFSRVVVDDVCGGYLATRHLIELGHFRIGYISDWLENPFNFTSSRFRFQGYRKALQEADIPFQSEYHRQGDHGREEARQLALELLSLAQPPTAIFAASDTQALGVLEAASAEGLSVPEDLSVIGYDDIEAAEYMRLTTIRQLLFESGQIGVELLLDRLSGITIEPSVVELPVELVVRATTATPNLVR